MRYWREWLQLCYICSAVVGTISPSGIVTQLRQSRIVDLAFEDTWSQLCLNLAVVKGIIQSSHRGLNDIIYPWCARVGALYG